MKFLNKCLIIFFFINYYIFLCNKEFLNYFNIESFNNDNDPKNIKSIICPNISLNCCNIKDQIYIYDKYKLINEKRKIDNHYMEYINNNTKLLKNISQLSKILTDYYKELGYYDNNSNINCRLYLNKINKFKISLIDLIIENVNKYSNFLIKLHNGFYCSLCDMNINKYYNINNNLILYSKGFCSKIIKNTIKILIWKYLKLPKFIEVFNNFISKCDTNFKYYIKRDSKVKYFNYNNNLVNKINACFNNKSSKDWISYCNFICKEFNVFKFNKFFTGDIVKLKLYNNYIIKYIEYMQYNKNKQNKISYTTKILKNSYDSINNNYRLLSNFEQYHIRNISYILDNDYEFENDPSFLESKIFNNNNIFGNLLIKNNLALINFKQTIRLNGLDLENYGKVEYINKNNYIILNIKQTKNKVIENNNKNITANYDSLLKIGLKITKIIIFFKILLFLYCF